MNMPGRITAEVTGDREIDMLAGRISQKWTQSSPGRGVRTGSIVQSIGRGRTRVVALEMRRARRPHPDR
jgi:hypothetical protein